MKVTEWCHWRKTFLFHPFLLFLTFRRIWNIIPVKEKLGEIVAVAILAFSLRDTEVKRTLWSWADAVCFIVVLVVTLALNVSCSSLDIWGWSESHFIVSKNRHGPVLSIPSGFSSLQTKTAFGASLPQEESIEGFRFDSSKLNDFPFLSASVHIRNCWSSVYSWFCISCYFFLLFFFLWFADFLLFYVCVLFFWLL